MPDAVIFDLDGVLLDSEQRWNEAKEALVRESGDVHTARERHDAGAREREPDLARREPDRPGQEDRRDREIEPGPGPVDQARRDEPGL